MSFFIAIIKYLLNDRCTSWLRITISVGGDANRVVKRKPKGES